MNAVEDAENPRQTAVENWDLIRGSFPTMRYVRFGGKKNTRSNFSGSSICPAPRNLFCLVPLDITLACTGSFTLFFTLYYYINITENIPKKSQENMQNSWQPFNIFFKLRTTESSMQRLFSDLIYQFFIINNN
jgi:hypothetical protein